MKASKLHSLSLLLLLAWSFFSVGCGMQKYDVAPDPKPRLDHAKTLEAQSPVNALEEYIKIGKEYGNGSAKSDAEAKKFREIAGDALSRAVVFGYNTIDPKRLLDPALSVVAKKELEALQFEAGDKALLAARDLVYQYGDTEAAKKASAPEYGDGEKLPLKVALERRIDSRNSHIYNYKIIDSMVKVTGANPYFSYWLALLVIAGIAKGITLPLTLKSFKSQREMQKIQPVIKGLQEKYKDDKATLNVKMMEAYKEHNINPLASCFPMLIQLPFFIWVYTSIRYYEFHFAHGYFFWISPSLGGHFKGILGGNLSEFDLILTLIYAVSNVVIMRMTPSPDPAAAQQQKQMSVMMTLMMLYMFLIYKWSSAFTLYWIMTNTIGAWQSWVYIYKPKRMEEAAAAANGGATIDVKAKPVAPASADKNGTPPSGNTARKPVNRNRKKR